jgi:hypothetical protein
MTLVESLQQLADAMDSAIATLDADRSQLAVAIGRIDTADSIAALMHSIDMARAREHLTGALTQLENARAQARLELFRTLQAEGCSIGEIARMWGISRQLASRIVRTATA